MDNIEYEVCIKRIDELEKRLDALLVIEKQNTDLVKTVGRLERENKELVDALRETEEALGNFDFGKFISADKLMGIAEIMHNINEALGGE